MYFDTHAHYDDEAFNEDRNSVLESLESFGVERVVNASSDMKSSRFGKKLASEYSFLYFAAGVHPHDSKNMTDDDFDELRELSKDKKCVAIGEIGLDYHYDLSPRDIQKKRFYEQMCLARELNLPVIIHEREACQDVLDIITQFKDVKGVVHCFSGSWETAKIVLNQGWYLSFTGVITFKNARRAIEVLEKIPHDRVMIETDCPYLAPVPVRGSRNFSGNLQYTARKAAEAMGISHEELAHITVENGKKFFIIE